MSFWHHFVRALDAGMDSQAAYDHAVGATRKDRMDTDTTNEPTAPVALTTQAEQFFNEWQEFADACRAAAPLVPLIEAMLSGQPQVATSSLPGRVWRGFIAAVTSPAAVKQERSLATLVLTRVLIAAGASAALVELAQKIIGG